MALSTTQSPTAWGSVHAYIGETTVDGDVPAVSEMTDLGPIDEDALSIETAKGTVYQLKDINGKLLDELEQEPEITVNFSLLKPSQEVRGEFWEVTPPATADDDMWIKSLVRSEANSFMFANIKAIGSESFKAPVVKLSMQPGYQSAKGWVNPCTAKVLNTGKKGWFAFGVVK